MYVRETAKVELESISPTNEDTGLYLRAPTVSGTLVVERTPFVSNQARVEGAIHTSAALEMKGWYDPVEDEDWPVIIAVTKRNS